MNYKIEMNKAHPSYLGWQVDWPLYVKGPMLTARGKVFKRGDYFPWAEMQFDPVRIAAMYKQGLLHHNATISEQEGHGDRLGEITGKKLYSLANMLNVEMKKKHCATEEEFKRKRCRVSTVADTQRRFIRQFLSKNPYMHDYFVSIREDYITKVIEEPAEEK